MRTKKQVNTSYYLCRLVLSYEVVKAPPLPGPLPTLRVGRGRGPRASSIATGKSLSPRRRSGERAGERGFVSSVKRVRNYSNGLGAGGGGGGFAFSSRAIKFERAAGGFCQARSARFIASSMRNRTTPLPWSIQAVVWSASASAARSSARFLARMAARSSPSGGGWV